MNRIEFDPTETTGKPISEEKCKHILEELT